MSSRFLAVGGLVLGAFAVLASQVLSYGLVYPARSHGKFPLYLALFGGVALCAVAAWLARRALRGEALESVRFLALVSFAISAFFLFVVLVGYGIPNLLLSPLD
jgi:hypothetical protein